MKEIDVLAAHRTVDPALHIWGWEIPVYLFLGGLVAGVMILAGALALRGEARSRAARWMPFAAPVLISLGMLALFLDLANKWNVHRFYLALRPASPMSWGAWILLGVYPASLLLGLAGVRDGEITLPARLEPLRAFAQRHARRLAIANVIFGAALGGYTGVLLGTLGARAAWGSVMLAPLFLVSGVSTGAALMMLFRLDPQEHHLVRRWDLAAIGLEIALIALFFLDLTTTGGAHGREAVALFFGGRFTGAFWALVVFAGLLVPFALESLEAKRALRPTVMAPVLLLTGGLALRWIVVMAGQA